MPKHIVNLLTGLGLPAEDATKIDSLTETEQETFDFKPYAEKVKANYHTQFQNDPTFFDDITLEKLPLDIKKKIENTQFGRAAKITSDKLTKGLGMTDADYAELTTEQKEKLELFVPAIAEIFSRTKTGDKELQNQLIDARKQLEKYGPEYETTIATKYETQANQKISSAIFNSNLIGELSSIPKLKIAASDIAKTASDILLNKYGFERIGEFDIELRQKDKPEMKVLKEGTSHQLTLKDALVDIATERGWIDEDDPDGNKGGGKINIVPKDGKLTIVSPHISDKIKRKIAEEAKA